MNKYLITFNECYKHSTELITKEVKGDTLYVDPENKLVLINSQVVADYDRINNIKFNVKGYYQSILINPRGILKTIDIPQPNMKGGE